MNKARSYLRNLAILLPLMLVILLLHGAYRTLREVPNLSMAMSEPFDILFFGDSVVNTAGACDRDRATLDRKFAAMVEPRVLDMVHAAFSPMVYAELIDVAAFAQQAPRYAIVPLNLRSFSEQWLRQPAFQFTVELSLIRLLRGRNVVTNFVTYLDARYADRAAREAETWKSERVSYPGYDLGVRRVFEDRIVAALRDQPHFECRPEKAAEFADELRLLFTYHYMNVIADSHPVLASLRLFHQRARSYGIVPVYYITPINHEEGTRLVGPDFRTRTAANVSRIMAFLEGLDAVVVNMAFDLPPERFTDRKWVAEHIDGAGRQHVAARLAAKIQELEEAR